jgi:hypothetical protein
VQENSYGDRGAAPERQLDTVNSCTCRDDFSVKRLGNEGRHDVGDFEAGEARLVEWNNECQEGRWGKKIGMLGLRASGISAVLYPAVWL